MPFIEGARYRLGAVAGDTTGYGPFVVAGTPVDGTAGTLAGTAEKGALVISSSAPDHYINGNTKASPTWKKVTRAA